MLRLRTLGSPAVEGVSGPLGGTAAQRMPLALLGLLAPAGDRGLSRDKVVGYLWPAADAEKAAHRLTQLVYSLRRDLQADDLFLGSSSLRLNPLVISTDVQEFSAARRAGDLERAVSLYGGPFLDGFFLTDALEFERWVENERTGFAREHAEALETLAAEAAARGDHRRAAAWWQRLADQDPFSTSVRVHLMSNLAAAGSRAEALEQARAYEELIRRELDAAPNPVIRELAERLRQGPSAAVSDTVIAVLPFRNLSPVPVNDYFAEGLGEELMNALARLEGVRVVARSSAVAFRNTELDAREIGRRLGASAYLEGSIRQAGELARLVVQLVNVVDGCQLWSERYEREVTNPFAVQDELVQLIVKEVAGWLARSRAQRQSSQPPG